ncbi:hypothetical protein DUI87_30825 [Hirundo rustica rustica]|uniref:ribonuclease H n=1 Tax=Hirundo rustica rustica TaxID=333673 RepID=A0A3M0IVS9_HIRRU|nr:hypothetical protein DUI87_30825 [Hirundo rustica rustica]
MESGQASGQLLHKRGEQQAQLDATCLSLAKRKREKTHLQEIKGFIWSSGGSGFSLWFKGTLTIRNPCGEPVLGREGSRCGSRKIPIAAPSARSVCGVNGSVFCGLVVLCVCVFKCGRIIGAHLKDAFFCLPLHEASQKIFAFEWESPKTGRKTQLTWCVLPQGYKNSPTIFGEQLAKDLESWEPPPGEGQLLQYVDDLLIATQTQETCVDWTVSLLNFLGLQGYRVSQKKAQIVRQTVIYLGYERFLKYQAILVEQDDVEIVVTNIVNPASFLYGSRGEPVIHDCLETIEATYSSRPDLKDIPLEDAETWFTDGSSYVVSGRRHAGYAVTTSKEVIESGPLPTNTSAQEAEIIALIRALELAKGKEINIYTDSRYAFGGIHAHGAIWKERGLLNSQGESIKHAQEILRLLDAIQLPERVAITHIKAHQK